MKPTALVSRRALIANAAGNTLGLVAQLAVSFFMAPVVLAALGKTRYGVWSFVESFLAYLMLFDLGVAASLVRFVPRHVATGDRDGLNRIFTACVLFFAAVAAVACMVGVTFALWVADWFLNIPDDLSAEARLVFILAVVNFALSLPLGAFPAILDGLGALSAKSATRTTFLLLRVPVLLAVLGTEARLLNMVIVLTASNLLEHFALAVQVFRRSPGLRFVPGEVTRDTFRQIRGYSLDSFLAMIAGRFSFQTDAFVIGRFLGLDAITAFANGNKLVDLSKAILRSPTWALTPAVSALDARGEADKVRDYFLRGSRFALYLVLPVQIGLFIFGRQFLWLWLGPAYAAASGMTMTILATTLSLTVAQSVASRVLYGMGRIRLFSRVALAEGVANVLLSVALVGPMGIEGVAWGTAIPHTAFCLFVLTHLGGMIGVRPREYLVAVVMKPAAAAVLLTGGWLLFAHAAPATTWAGLLADGLAGLILYAIAVLTLDGRRLIDRALSRLPRTSTSVRPVLPLTTPPGTAPHNRRPSRAAG
jgi:O-antigen/teichoic acid export membrane protein